MSGVNSSEIRKVAQCVYLVCEESIAPDIAAKCKRIADAYDSSQELIAKLTEQLDDTNEMVSQRGIDNTMLRVQVEKQAGQIKLLREALAELVSESTGCANTLCSEATLMVQNALAATAKG